jgi:mannose-6-phosphate isomerase-like protein (cupin superfamily)
LFLACQCQQAFQGIRELKVISIRAGGPVIRCRGIWKNPGNWRITVRAISFAFVFVALGAAAAAGQQPAAPAATPVTAMKTFCSSADVQALIAKAKSERKEGQPIVVERVVQLVPYMANLEYRASVGPAAVHEKEAELMYVVDGSGTITTGGTLVNQTRTNPANLTGTGIDGGAPQKIAKGDFIFIPENTPHWINTIDGTIILVTLHVPRPVPGS